MVATGASHLDLHRGFQMRVPGKGVGKHSMSSEGAEGRRTESETQGAGSGLVSGVNRNVI